jgi:hypothetical protein
MMIDYTITVGNIVEIISILGGGMFALARVSSKIDVKIALLHQDFSTVKGDVIDMKSDIKRVNDVLVSLADLRGEINVLRARVTASNRDLSELRHGHGWVTGPTGIEREYGG